jgi:tetratricopeptide (TPR) repeat protein
LKNYRLNVGLLLRTAAILIVLAVCTHLVHGWQMRRHSGEQVARADAAEREGDSSEAGASLGRALAFHAEDDAVRRRYGLYLADRATTRRARWQALQLLHGVLARDPGAAEVAIKAAELAMALGEPGEASKYLAAALSRLPDRADLHEMDARARLAAGDAQAAAGSLRRSLELEPGRVSSAVLLAEVLRVKLGDFKQADEVMDRLVKDNPRSAAALLARARHRMTALRLEPASSDLALARKLAPSDLAVRTASAELEGLRGDFAACAGHWQAVLALDPERVDAYLGLVRAERERGQPQKAIEPLRRGLKRMPAQPDLLFALADLLIDRGQTAEADTLRAHLSRSRAEGRVYYLTGRMEQEQKHWQKAVAAFTKAASASDLLPSDKSRLYLALARCHAEMGVRDEQVSAVRQAFHLYPAPAVCLEWAGVLLANRAVAEAVSLLRSLSQMPVPPPAVWPLLAQALFEHNLLRPAWQRDWTEAERALDRASKTPADAVRTALLRVCMHLVRDDVEQARKTLAEAQQRHPDEPLLWKARAELALREKDDQAVRAVLDEADRRLGNRIDWLLVRADLLALQPGSSPMADLQKLEMAADRLPAEDRDRLERHLAEVASRQGNHAAVERLCARLLARHSDNLRARMLLLQVKLAWHDDRGATVLVNEMRRLEGEEGVTWRSATASCLISRAARGDRSGLGEARKRIQEVRQRRPGWSHADFLAGRLADLERKPAEALESYRRVLQQGDYHPLAVRRVVQLLSAEGRYADANGVLEVVQWHGALAHDLLRPAADIALRAGKPERACALALTVVSGEIKSASDLVWLGRILQAAGRPTEAEDAFTRAVRLDPETPGWWLPLLSHLVRQGKTDEAEAALARMQREVLADLVPLAVAQAREVMGQLDQAERAYRQILKSAPRDSQALMGLLRLYMRGNRNAHAERVLHLLFDHRVLVREEDLPEVRRLMALAITAPERRTPQVERALSLLALNRVRDPDNPADLCVSALVRGALPVERAAALRSLESLPQGSMSFPERLRLAQLYDAAGNWPQARTHLLALLEEDGRNTACMAVLIDGLLRHDKKAEAAGWLERLAKIEPDAERTRELRERMLRPSKAKP